MILYLNELDLFGKKLVFMDSLRLTRILEGWIWQLMLVTPATREAQARYQV